MLYLPFLRLVLAGRLHIIFKVIHSGNPAPVSEKKLVGAHFTLRPLYVLGKPADLSQLCSFGGQAVGTAFRAIVSSAAIGLS